VNFTITGLNFQPGYTTVTVWNKTTGALMNTTDIISITPTRINASIGIPAEAPTGLAYKIDVTTLDGGNSTYPTMFTVNKFPPPVIVSINPKSGYLNETTDFILTGSNFQTNGRTFVNLSRTMVTGELNTTLYSVTPTQITGSIMIPPGTLPGTWNVNVTTLDGGAYSGPNLFTVAKVPVPVITSFTPATMYRGTSATFTLQGTSFQMNQRTVVNLTNASGYNLTTTLSSVSPTLITGAISLPSDAVPGLWNVNVTTVNGGMGTKPGAVYIL
jgi:hypothetical protein